METSGEKHYELRNRSRSRSETPQILVRNVTENEESEHQYDLRSRSRDRSMTPGEVTSSRRSSSRPSSVVKGRNKNMDTIVEQKDDTLTDNTSETQSKSSDKSATVTKTTRKVERRSERQRVKRQIFANGQSEVKDDSSDTKSETKERKRESLTPKRMMTSDYSSEEGDREDVPSRPGSAYEFYKQAGEYWNKFPKTDYTYSQASTCRYEVAPGVMAIPNMSRRSLHSDNSFFSGQTTNSQSSKESFNDEASTMDANNIRKDLASGMVPQVLPHVRGTGTAGQSVIYKRTHYEQHSSHREYIYDSADDRHDNQINEKYEKWADPLLKSRPTNRYRSTTNVDSDTEIDEDYIRSDPRYSLQMNTQSFSKFTSLISTWFFTTLHFITFGHFKQQRFSTTSHYYRRYEESRWSRLRRQMKSITQSMYLLLVKTVLLDSWLLSRASNIRERVQGRRTKILWLILLPLLLTIGCWTLPYIMPYIMSAIRTYSSQTALPIKEEKQTAQSYYIQDDLTSNEELRNIVDLLINRVQHLESAKAQQSEHLSNVTQVLEDLKRTDSNAWKHYDEKLQNLEQVLEEQKIDRERCRSEELDVIHVEFQNLKQLYSQLKTCCDQATANSVNEETIRKQADDVFAGYFGESFSKEDILRVFQIMNSKIHQEEIQKSSENLVDVEPATGLGVDEIRKIVLGILKIYDADKTGRVDYALESAGGQIISTRCTQRYNVQTRAFKLLGMTLFYESNNPRTVIQGNTLQPGMCWAFQDFPGYLLVKLRSFIYVTGFTLEHASKSNLPNGEMKSAPKNFNVWGLTGENDLEPVLFGEYEFSVTDESLQYFPVQNTSITTPFEYVELRIHSNHGQLEYTCLYRFRVHGNLA